VCLMNFVKIIMLIKKYCGFTINFFLISTNCYYYYSNSVVVLSFGPCIINRFKHIIRLEEGGENDVSANHDGEFHGLLFIRTNICISDEMQYTVFVY